MKTKPGLFLALFSLASIAHSQWDAFPGDSFIQPSYGTKTRPAIAAGNNSYLVVWSDSRSNPSGSSDYETGADIYGIRLNALGQLLDPVPFSIASDKAAQTSPKVSWNGTNWLVTYESVAIDGNGGYYTSGIQARRVSPSGTVLDSRPINLYGLTPSGYGYALESDGNNWVVVNQGGPVTTSILAMRVSPQGTVLDTPTKILVPGTYYMRSNMRLAYAGGVFLLTFDETYQGGYYDTGSVRFDSNLNLLTNGIVKILDRNLSGLTSNGTNFLLAWGYQRPDFYFEVRAKRVNPAGTSLDGAGLVLTSPAYPGYGNIAAWWDQSNFRVGWVDFDTPKVARISSSGVVSNFNGIAVPGFGFESASGIAGELISVAAVQNVNDIDIRASRLRADGVVAPPVITSTGLPTQVRPDVAAHPDGFVTVFESRVSGTSRILAQLIDATGRKALSRPIPVTGYGAFMAPSIAWNGDLFAIVWSDSTGILVRRMGSDGKFIDANPIRVISSAFGPADIAAVGDTFFVTARKYGSTAQVIVPVGARFNGSTGTVLDSSPRLLINTSAYLRTPPRVVELGGKWFVAFTSNFSHNDSGATTAGVFVTTAGSVGTTFGIQGPFSTAGGNFIFDLGLGSNGQTALLVQPQELTSGVENDLLCRTISANGAIGPLVNLTPWEGNQYRPNVVWDGYSFVIAYQEQRNRFSMLTLDPIDARSDLFGMRISATGQPIDPNGFELSSQSLAESHPTLASLGGRTLFAASRMMHEVPFTIEREGSTRNGTVIAPPNARAMNSRINSRVLGAPTNKWPVAIASASGQAGDIPYTVTFIGSSSFDLDGTIVETTWDFGDGATANTPTASHTYTVPGEYIARLTVRDQAGQTTSQALKVIAKTPNLLPIAAGSQSVTSGRAPLDVTFSAVGSYDPDGFLGNCTWLSSNGITYYGGEAYYTFSTPGTYTVRLTVNDAVGATATKVFTVQVNP